MMIIRRAGLSRISIASADLAMTATAAHAYLDPGTGSMILQIVLGGVAGLMVVGKLYWAKFTSFFSRRSDSVSAEGEETPAEER